MKVWNKTTHKSHSLGLQLVLFLLQAEFLGARAAHSLINCCIRSWGEVTPLLSLSLTSSLCSCLTKLGHKDRTRDVNKQAKTDPQNSSVTQLGEATSAHICSQLRGFPLPTTSGTPSTAAPLRSQGLTRHISLLLSITTIQTPVKSKEPFNWSPQLPRFTSVVFHLVFCIKFFKRLETKKKFFIKEN